MAIQESSIKAKILRMLAGRERSRAELEKKLKNWLQAQIAKEQTFPCSEEETLPDDLWRQTIGILNEFEQRGWVSDQRMAESIIHQKSARLGSARLRQELKAKGLSDALTQEMLEEVKNSEFERAYGVWVRKFRQIPEDAAAYQKQARFLTYRGFSANIIRKVLAGEVPEN